MNKTERFAKACFEVRQRDFQNKEEFNFLGHGREKVVTLKSVYARIASKYLYYELKSNSRVFSWRQVTDACTIAGFYVTDVVNQQLPGK